MSPADQVTVTYIVVGIVVGLISWLATGNRGSGALIVNLAAALAGAFGVEILLHRLFGVYATFGSLDNLIGTSIVKSATGAIVTVLLMRLVLHFIRARGGARARG
jgi:uncharacterized membrane protein YeaQ/YmgE (transglycosylase-associated protein family)